MEHTHSFGYWLRRRRKALDLTQEALAEAVSVSRFAIRKIEADERRPSRRLAERLADRLAIPAEERTAFLNAARAVQATSGLAVSADPVEPPDAQPERGARGRVNDAPADAMQPIAAREGSAGSAATPPEAPTQGLGPLPFVGREEEFGQIVGLLARLTGKDGVTVLVEGEPGIGKSRILREVVRHAQGIGVRTLRANCYEIEQSMPYEPVIELIGEAMGQVQDAALREMPAVSLAEIAALVPQVAERCGNLPTLSAYLPEARQARLFHAIEQLFDAIAAQGPLLIAVDDIHWVDDASLRFLHHLARRVQGRRVLLMLTYRGEEVAADERLAALIERIRREGHTRHFPLRRWSASDTRAFLAATVAPDPGARGLDAWLHRETEGHPFFLVSILQSLLEQGLLDADAAGRDASAASTFSTAAPTLPEALRASVRSRIARVPREVRAILDAAAVLGRRFDFDTLQAIAGVPAGVLLDAVEALVTRRLLREETEVGVYDFSHDKVREAVYLEIGSARRMLLHRAVAAEWERHATGNERAARIAEHYERGQAWPKAVAYLMQAAERSLNLFAMREALGLLDRAVAIAEAHRDAIAPDVRWKLLEQRGAARAQAGHMEGAVADIERVIEAARAAGEREHERDLTIQLGMAYRRADAYDRAKRCLSEALAASRALNDARHAADTLYHLGTVDWSDGHNVHAIACHQEAVELCRQHGFEDLVAVQAFHGRGEAYFADGHPAPAIACYERSIELARKIGDKSYECENLMMIGWACSGWMGLGDYPRTLAHFDVALEIASAADLQWHVGPILIGRDMARACTGSYREAWASMNRTLERLEPLKLKRYQLMACNMLGALLLELDQCARAVDFFERGLAIATEIRTMYWRPLLVANLAIARMRQGRLDVQSELQEALRFTEENRERWIVVRCLEALAELSHARGEHEACAAYAERLLGIGKEGNLREQIAIAERWRGAAFLGQQAYEQAEAALREAAPIAAAVGRLRLEWDVANLQAKLSRARGESAAADDHAARAGKIAGRIADDLRGSELAFAVP